MIDSARSFNESIVLDDQKRKKAIETLNKEKEKQLNTINESSKKYKILMQSQNFSKNYPVSAFVIFRSMEGQARAIDAFKIGCCDKVVRTCGIRGGTSGKSSGWQPSPEKRFKGKWLKVEKAVDPELLIWDNFGIGCCSRFFRTLVFWISFIGILIFCLWSVVNLEITSQGLDKLQPKVDCSKIEDFDARF